MLSQELIDRVNKAPAWQMQEASPIHALPLHPSPGDSSMELTGNTTLRRSSLQSLARPVVQDTGDSVERPGHRSVGRPSHSYL